MNFQTFFKDNLENGIFGNSWEAWIGAACLSVGILILAYIIKSVIAGRLRKFAAQTETKWDDAALFAIDSTTFAFCLVLALHFGTQALALPSILLRGRDMAFFLVLFAQLGIWLTSALHHFGEESVRSSLEKDPAKATTISTLVLVGDVAIWITMVLLALANLGADISALVAGLGIGGVAVAFALQNVLGDLFASFSIVFDKPFAIGDAINANGIAGTVEHIGLKTTRIRATSGEQLIFSNSDLLKNVLRNYKRMDRRRVLFNFGVTYETKPQLLDRAREIVKAAITEEKQVTFERCHMNLLSASSLDYETVYWVESSDYNTYMDAHHRILVRMIEAFAREGLDFAYPHQVSVPKIVDGKKI